MRAQVSFLGAGGYQAALEYMETERICTLIRENGKQENVKIVAVAPPDNYNGLVYVTVETID